jgi:hypothetical protein
MSRTKIVEVLRPDGEMARFEVPDEDLRDASVSQVAEDIAAIKALTGDTRSDAAVARACVSRVRDILERRMQ